MKLVKDLIVTWPKNMDYPLWREMVRKYRTEFNNVIIVWMEPNKGEDYTDFIKEAMFKDFVLFVESPRILPGEDWRNVAVNAGLEQSLHAPWIWFTEQDFFPGTHFFKLIDDQSVFDYDIYYTNDRGRMHPCNILIKRELLNQTSKDFSAAPEKGYDHFGKIQADLKELPYKAWVIDEYFQLGPESTRTFEHLNGLTHNFNLLSDGQKSNYQPERFKEYLKECLNVSVPLDPRWTKVAQTAL